MDHTDMEENKNSEEESMMTPSEFLDVKLEPVVSDYIPSSGAFLGSNQDYPVLDLMSNTQPTNVDAENDSEETIYDIANLSPIVTFKEEPIDNGNFSPIENEHESENMSFVKPVENLDGNKSISRMNNGDHHVYFDENVCIKEELEVIEEIPEDINSLDNSQDSHDERDFTNQKNAENVVYIKEEVSGIGEENTKESSALENIQEDNSFGQHFLTSFFPSVVKYECSNDQMIDEELSTSQDTQPITQNQALPDPSKLYSPAYTTENTNKGEHDIGKNIFRLNGMQGSIGTHPNSKTKPMLKCRYCSFTTLIKCQLRYHHINKHNFGMEPIDCPYCKFRSVSLMEVEDHIAKRHKAPKVYHHCPLCLYKSSCSGNVRYHIKAVHTKEKEYSCPYCHHACIHVHNLRKHIFAVHKKKLNVRHLESVCHINNKPDSFSV